jgi:hypothetical protein
VGAGHCICGEQDTEGVWEQDTEGVWEQNTEGVWEQDTEGVWEQDTAQTYSLQLHGAAQSSQQ